MKTWVEAREITIPASLQEAIGGHPLVIQTLVRRGLGDLPSAQAFIDPGLYHPADPDELPGLSLAVDRLEAAIHDQEPICVWGDFDVDGQTATTVLFASLRGLGAKVTYHIPVRATESHGIHIPTLAKVIQQGARLILTCDTGITAHEAIDYAKNHGVEVIVTDHHDLPSSLPTAYALVNPKLLPSTPLAGVLHPLGSLPGVGVAYKLAEALYLRAGGIQDACQFLDLAALGIVADLAILRGETRYLLQLGLEALRNTKRLGLQVMMDMAELIRPSLTEEHIAYEIAPRLNALGRLSDANLSVELLTTTDLGRARVLAVQLEGMNAHRKLLTDQVYQAALAQIERDPNLLKEAVLVLSHPAWPAGAVGIVASRLVERFNRPTILLSASPGEPARGSARSIEGCNITAAIAAHGEMLTAYGGHPMAAGLSIDPERIPEFRHAISRTVSDILGEVKSEPQLEIDGVLPLSNLTQEVVEDLERLAPFGPGNPSLVLVSPGLVLKNYTCLGRNAEHLELSLESEARNDLTEAATVHKDYYKVVWWQATPEDIPPAVVDGARFDLAYHVRRCDYRGQSGMQIEWVDVRLLAEPKIEFEGHPMAIEVVDFRQHPQPVAILKNLLAQCEIQVWCEGSATQKLAAYSLPNKDRYALSPAPALAIWTSPPGISELRQALEKATPHTVYLFGINPGMNDLESFIKHLAGLVKYALSSNQGHTRVSLLAAATAQRTLTVLKGLAWLVTRGHITFVEDDDNLLLTGQAPRSTDRTGEVVDPEAALIALLAESAAFRAYFAHADKDSILPNKV